MAIQVKRDELLRRGARINLAHPVAPTPLPRPASTTTDTSLAEAISKIAAALANSQAEQRATIYQALVINEQQITAIASSLKKGEVEYQNWNVNITKRDALGRIAEVQFRPTKA